MRKQSRPRSGNGRSLGPGTTPQQRLLTVKDVADQLGVSVRSVSRWVESRALVAHKLGRLVRVGELDLREFLARRRGF